MYISLSNFFVISKLHALKQYSAIKTVSLAEMLAVSENTVHFSDKKTIFTLHLTLTLLPLVYVCVIAMVICCATALHVISAL